MIPHQQFNHPLTNEAAADFIMGIIYAEAKRRADTITLPRAEYHEVPAHIAADAMRKGRDHG